MNEFDDVIRGETPENKKAREDMRNFYTGKKDLLELEGSNVQHIHMIVSMINANIKSLELLKEHARDEKRMYATAQNLIDANSWLERQLERLEKERPTRKGRSIYDKKCDDGIIKEEF